jgi:hypothetical protein
MRRWQRIGVLVAPWTFVSVFAAVWLGVLVPRALDGHAALICISLLAGVALASFAIAAVTFSRDVLSGRWP